MTRLRRYEWVLEGDSWDDTKDDIGYLIYGYGEEVEDQGKRFAVIMHIHELGDDDEDGATA